MKLGIYKHYKGHYYLVTGIAEHTETKEELIIYTPLNDINKSKLYARPRKMFEDIINIEDKENKPPLGSMYSACFKNVPRFEFIKDRLD